MPHLVDDLRLALRMLRLNPSLATVAILSLALGIGGSCALFALVDGLLLHPLPAIPSEPPIPGLFAAGHGAAPRLVVLTGNGHMLSFADYQDYAARQDLLSGLAATAACDLDLTRRGPAERISGLAVSGSYFAVLGLTPARGRLLSPADERAPVAVLGYGLWHRRFGGQASIVGTAVTLNGKALTVVGIAPPGFAGTDLATRRELWVPLGAWSTVATGVLVPFSGGFDRKKEWLHTVGRLASGVSLRAAAAGLDLTARRLAAAYPATNARRGVRLVPLAEAALGPGPLARPRLRTFTKHLLAAIGAVLAVANLNVAGLLLARVVGRRREIAIRLSLGASRWRLVQQMTCEALLLACLAGLAGVALARAGLPLLERLELPVPLAVRDFALSGRVLAATLGLTLACSLGCGLLPALHAAGVEVVPALRGAAPRTGRRRAGGRDVLVALQVAAAFVILVAAGLFLRTMAKLEAVPPGFDATHLLAATIDLAPAGYRGPQVTAFYGELLDRLRQTPGVIDASLVSALPILGADLEVDLGVEPADPPGPGVPPAGGSDAGSQSANTLPSLRHVLVGSRYFQTLRMRLLRGRDFGREDAASSAGSVILNESAARQLWPGQDALGLHVRLAQMAPTAQPAAPFTVIGLVADSTYASPREERRPMLYLAHAQSRKSFIGAILAPQMTLLVRTAGDARSMLGAVRARVGELDPRLPVVQASTAESLLSATLGLERQAAALYGALALVAVGLALLGLAGALLRSVAERTREIGVRVACGATRGRVARLVLGRGLLVVLAGIVAGAVLGVPTGRLLADQLYGVGALDPLTWSLAPLLVLGLAGAASALPAVRAMNIDPVRAMQAG